MKRFYETYETNGMTNKYLTLEDLINFFKDLGYRTNTITNVIEKLIEFELLESEDFVSDIEFNSLENNVNLCISSKGYYYFKELIKKFHYIDLVLQDTPIFSQEYFEKIKSIFPQSDQNGIRNLNSRVETVKLFFDYLLYQENQQAISVIKVFGKPLEYIREDLFSDIQKIESKL